MADLYISPVTNPNERKKADSLDKDYITSFVVTGNRAKIIVNDELLEDGSTLLTVTPRAWREMDDLL